jgi:hypothetical protein
MILCRCGYEAGDAADLSRHITSWLRWFDQAGTPERGLEHVED